jgi:hypothetical protein
MKAGVLLYSGRRDPEWTVQADAAAALAATVKGLPELVGASPAPSRLGYRGAWVRMYDGGRVVAFNGTLTMPDGRFRADPDRAFERSVLDSAPPGVLPMRADALFAM